VDTAFQNIIGDSLAIRAAIALARKVAQHPLTTVLLHGETGSGKELFTRGIHYSGPNATEPFVAINCAAIPENLIESELFGHERGAFTDARTQKKGLFELAGRGTVFLDEIEELPPKSQPKLLRALEDRRVRRVGGTHEIPIACRIVAATNRDLSVAVATGRFREDLYYRLSVFRIEIPSLRGRDGDIDILARHFVTTYCLEHGIAPKTISPTTAALLRVHPWPGNVRELKNALERAVIVCDGAAIEPHHITLQMRSNVTGETALHSSVGIAATITVPLEGLTISAVEKQLIETTLRLTDHNHSRTARMLGISRPTLLKKLLDYGLR
jgi:DNA-binding NtrC family response regulator